jgi:hypothetical protein
MNRSGILVIIICIMIFTVTSAFLIKGKKQVTGYKQNTL